MTRGRPLWVARECGPPKFQLAEPPDLDDELRALIAEAYAVRRPQSPL